ncbi:hypothetical protein L1987_15348 [Smallanthus sonchifolius]|uniref:Uncharacterized protein n=1 Tax=Smallanthus sonchifolius TaxID=185202 RepID=A0ACB9J5V1_9ASTR|nr:hypothetical protein L1987_15348 [Smallanthus sonchifolius]
MAEIMELMEAERKEAEQKEASVAVEKESTTAVALMAIGEAQSSSSEGRPKGTISNHWYVDSGCSRHMTGNMALLQDVKPFRGGYVAFAGEKGGSITCQGVVSNGCVSFDNVNFCEQLKHNLLSVSQMCDKEYSVMFDKSECLILKPGFEVPKDWILMRAPRSNDTYQIDMSVAKTTSSVATCLLTKATELDSILKIRIISIKCTSSTKHFMIDSTLFIRKAGGDILLVQVYVDDIIFGSTNEGMCREFEKVMKSKFEMSNMGELSFFLGLQVSQRENGIYLHQTKYVQDILSKYKMSDSTTYGTPIPVNHGLHPDRDGKDVDSRLYRGMIGSLMYLTASRPDIMFAVCLCSRFQSQPKESHMIAVKRIFRYLKGKPRLGLWYSKQQSFDFKAYTDSDYGGCNLDRKSTSGGCQFLGDRLVSWQCKKQSTVSVSTCEAEYIAAASGCSQILWIQQQLRDYGLNFTGTPLFIDNNATMSITNNPVKHSKTKHIEIRHHFIRDCAEKHLIELVKVHTDDNLADLFTKAFDRSRFEHLVNLIGMFNPE